MMQVMLYAEKESDHSEGKKKAILKLVVLHAWKLFPTGQGGGVLVLEPFPHPGHMPHYSGTFPYSPEQLREHWNAPMARGE